MKSKDSESAFSSKVLKSRAMNSLLSRLFCESLVARELMASG